MKKLNFVTGIAIASALFVSRTVHSHIVEIAQKAALIETGVIAQNNNLKKQSSDILHQALGHQVLGTLHRAQQFYRLNHDVFASHLSDLSELNKSTYEIFDYEIIPQNNPMQSAVVTATSKIDNLNSFLGIVWQDDNRFTQLICETKEHSIELPKISRQFTELNTARQCPEGMKPLYSKASRYDLGMILRSQLMYRLDAGRFANDISLLDVSLPPDNTYIYTTSFPADPAKSVIIRGQSTALDSKNLIGIVIFNTPDKIMRQ